MINEYDAIPIEIQFIDDFDIDYQNKTVKLKPTASKQAIQAFIRDSISKQTHGDIVYNSKKLSKLMIDKFKEMEIYKLKSNEEREEIIQYLIENPDIEDPNPKIISV